MHPNFNHALVPEIIFDNHPEYIELYKKAWELASDHVWDTPGLPVPHHMDEAFAPDRIWIWDTCFMVHYCKFAPDFFPGIQSLDNFYRPLHDDEDTSCLIHHPDNPPLFAWVEYEYFKFTGDKSRIYRNLVEKKYLQKHYQFMENVRYGQRIRHSFCLDTFQKNEIGYFWSGVSSGMDNTPRGGGIYNNIYWIDAIAQQALSALCIAKLASVIGEKQIEEEYTAKYQEHANTVNQSYYDEKDGCYYDIYAVNYDFCRILTPASFWPLLAEIAPRDRAIRQIATIRDPNLLGGELPLPTVARNSEYFEEDGRYWLGGVWLPTTYMTAKALEKYGELDLAAEVAEKTVARMSKVFQTYQPATIWEAYAPSARPTPAAAKRPGTVARPDFCGWSALGPISLLIENIIGLYDVNAVTETVKLHRRKNGTHGIRNFRFGNIICDLLMNDSGIRVRTDHEFTLEVNGVPCRCKVGEQEFPGV